MVPAVVVTVTVDIPDDTVLTDVATTWWTVAAVVVVSLVDVATAVATAVWVAVVVEVCDTGVAS